MVELEEFEPIDNLKVTERAKVLAGPTGNLVFHATFGSERLRKRKRLNKTLGVSPVTNLDPKVRKV